MKTVMRTVLCALALTWATTSPAAETTAIDEIDFATEVAFEQALEERENGDLDKAIEAFRTILSSHPGFHRGRLALAVAYYQNMQFARARSEAEAVLQAPDSSEESKQQIQAFLGTLDKADVRHKVVPSILVGLTVDSNVNVAPDDAELTLPGGGSIVLPSSATSADDYGLLLQASLSHRYLAPQTRKMGGQEAAFLWQSRADVFSTTYSDVTDQNIQLIKLESGPAQYFGRSMQARLRGVASQLWLDGGGYLSILGLRPSISFNARRVGLTTLVDAEYQNRNYQQSADAGRDSDYRAAKLRLVYSLPRGHIQAGASVQGFNENAQNDQYSRTGRTYGIDLSGVVSGGTRLLAHAEWTWADYTDPEPYYGIARNDRIIRWRLGAEHTFSDTALKDWTVITSLNHSRNITNISSYSYRRNQALIAFRRSF